METAVPERKFLADLIFPTLRVGIMRAVARSREALRAPLVHLLPLPAISGSSSDASVTANPNFLA